MNHKLLAAAFTILVSAAGAWTQNSEFAIPFAFHVGESALNPGTYTVIPGQPCAGMIRFVSRANTTDQAFTAVFFDNTLDRTVGVPKLVFTRYGSNEYFLSQMLDPRYPSSLRAVKSKREVVTSKLIARGGAGEVAVLAVSRLR